MADYIKLSSLVGSNFRVEEVGGYTWKMWSEESSTMLTSETYVEGYRKLYSVTTNKGLLDMSSSQVGQMLEGVVKAGKADLVGKTFAVKSNGKTGKEIRYWLNPVNTDASDEELPDGW